MSAGIWYSDPISGSFSNNGRSAATPWPGLQAVLASKGSSLRPGDTVYLLRGHHGAPLVTGVKGASGAPPVTLAAAPGHTPVVTTLTFVNAARWKVVGVLVAPFLVNAAGRIRSVFTDEEDGAGAGAGAGFDGDAAAEAEADAAADGDADADAAAGAAAEAGAAGAAAADEDAAPAGGGSAGAANDAALEADSMDDDAVPQAGDVTLAKPRGVAVTVRPRGITISSQALEDCQNIVLQGCTLTLGQLSGSWTAAQWQKSTSWGGIHLFGKSHTVDGCHVLNAGGVYVYFHSNGAMVRNTVIENFASDAMNIKASNVTVTDCIIVGAHKVNNNHNDMCQGWGSSDVVFVNNQLVAYVGSPDGFTARDVQGLGAFDGWKTKWVIKNNHVATDHPIGIWVQGDDRCVVTHNTVTRCGPTTFFKSSLPSILLGPSKTGAVKGGSVLENNLAEAYRTAGAALASSVANVTILARQFPVTFVRVPSDVHLLPTATTARGAGAGAAFEPGYTDADGLPHVPGAPYDVGCLQYRAGYRPQGATPAVRANAVIPVPGLGFEVSWAPAPASAAPSRSVEILRNGARAVITRAAAARGCFFVIDTSAAAGPVADAFSTRYVPDVCE